MFGTTTRFALALLLPLALLPFSASELGLPATTAQAVTDWSTGTAIGNSPGCWQPLDESLLLNCYAQGCNGIGQWMGWDLPNMLVASDFVVSYRGRAIDSTDVRERHPGLMLRATPDGTFVGMQPVIRTDRMDAPGLLVNYWLGGSEIVWYYVDPVSTTSALPDDATYTIIAHGNEYTVLVDGHVTWQFTEGPLLGGEVMPAMVAGCGYDRNVLVWSDFTLASVAAS